MNAEQKDEETIFKMAIRLKTSEERKAYLKRACKGDANETPIRLFSSIVTEMCPR